MRRRRRRRMRSNIDAAAKTVSAPDDIKGGSYGPMIVQVFGITA